MRLVSPVDMVAERSLAICSGDLNFNAIVLVSQSGKEVDLVILDFSSFINEPEIE